MGAVSGDAVFVSARVETLDEVLGNDDSVLMLGIVGVEGVADRTPGGRDARGTGIAPGLVLLRTRTRFYVMSRVKVAF